jgi:hypothetical protein
VAAGYVAWWLIWFSGPQLKHHLGCFHRGMNMCLYHETFFSSGSH